MENILEQINVPEITARPLDRLKYLLSLSRKSQARFAKLINIDPSSMSKILAGKMPLSEPFINRVVVNLGVSKRWLLTGEGVPFEKGGGLITDNPAVPVAAEVPKGAPVYDIDVTAGCMPLGSQFASAPILGYIDLPNISAGSPVVRVSGDSMQPRIPDGSYIAIRPIKDSGLIVWGSTYVVELEDYRLVKVIRKCKEDSNKIILHSLNPDYDDIEVDRSAVLRLYIVESVVNYQILT